jgi:hypothetical protein
LYYRQFISGFTNIAKSLNRLTEEKQASQWTQMWMPPFKHCTAPILAYLQPGERFIVDTDASNIGIGGVLSQIRVQEEQTIAYYSKTLNRAKRNDCVT